MIQFDLRKTTNENAAIYFDKSKKLRSKIQGIVSTIESYEKKIEVVKKKEMLEKTQFSDDLERKQRKKEWFEKYHWFYTSKGNLCIGGRDASTNEQVIKKHTDSNDLVFHTDMAGSPFFILKRKTQDIDEQELFEVGSITACYSKAFKKGFVETNVFYVLPSQVTKEAQSGEFLSKGSFMIRGKTTYVSHEMKIAVYIDEKDRVAIGSARNFKKETPYCVISEGSLKTSDAAKKMYAFFKKGFLDEFIKIIPPGGVKIQLFNYNS